MSEESAQAVRPAPVIFPLMFWLVVVALVVVDRVIKSKICAPVKMFAVYVLGIVVEEWTNEFTAVLKSEMVDESCVPV